MYRMPILLTALLLAVVPATAKDKKLPHPYAEALKSMVLLKHAQGHCTATAVRFDPPTYLTASHCITEPLGTIDDRPVQLTMLAGELAVVRVPDGKARPVFILGSRPAYGDPIAMDGFGGPYRIPFILEARMIADNQPPHPEAEAPSMVFSAGAMAGMSGGPVLDADGKLISILLCSGHYNARDAYFACGSTYDETADLYRAATAR